MSAEDYVASAHRIQAATKALAGVGGDEAAGATPISNRIGLNIAMSEHAALVKLLVDAGLFTAEQYEAALIEAHGDEVTRLARQVEAAGGPPADRTTYV